MIYLIIVNLLTSAAENQALIFCHYKQGNDSTNGGKLIFHIFSALAEFERDLIRERTHAGLKAARVRGRMGDRPPVLNSRQINRMIEMYDEQKIRWLKFAKFMISADHPFIIILSEEK